MMARISHRLAWLAFLMCLVTPGIAQIDGVDGIDDVSQIPQRPVNHILDTARWFTLNERESMGRELARVYKENEIDLYVVTRSKQPPQGAQTYARKLGETWTRSAVWCVVFHVPGDPSGFHVEAGGVAVERERVASAVAEASRRARKEMTEKDCVIAAWKECSENLRFVYSRTKRANEHVVKDKMGRRTDDHQKRTHMQTMIAAVVVGLLLCVGLAYTIYRWHKRRAFVFEFPETTWRTRFQGPHSGGGGIVLNYRRKRLK